MIQGDLEQPSSQTPYWATQEGLARVPLEKEEIKTKEDGIFATVRGQADPRATPFADDRAKQHWFTRAYVCFAPGRQTIQRWRSKALKAALISLGVLLVLVFWLAKHDTHTFRISRPVIFGDNGPLASENIPRLVQLLQYHSENTLKSPEGEGPFATNVVAAHHLGVWQKVLLLHECDESKRDTCSLTGAYTLMINPSIQDPTPDTPRLNIDYVPLMCPGGDDTVATQVPRRIKVYYSSPSGQQFQRVLKNPYNVIFVYQTIQEQYGVWPCQQTDLKVPREL